MKKFVLFAILSVMMFLSSYNDCKAKDIWVAHWASENVDIYVMDDTIINDSSNDSRCFKVSTKRVRDGKLLNVINWEFIKYESDMWRYETSTMDGLHATVVIPRNAVFEFCMNQLGWSYRIQEYWYY